MIPLHKEFLQFDWLRAVAFQLNLKYLLVKIYKPFAGSSINIYYIDTDEIPGFLLLLKNHIFNVCSEDTIFIFHM